jgi:predicted nucleotidyltransferase
MIKFPGVNRPILYQCVVGSHNYNLNEPDSDRDYRVFVCPTFDDLYYGKQYSAASVGTDVDYTAHDIRKLAELMWKGNINFIETLFADDYYAAAEAGCFFHNILTRREELARINLSNLWDAGQGMSQNKFNNLKKGTSGTRHLVDKYGYDTKQALHCYRCLDLLERYNAFGFLNFKQALWYEEGPERDFMMEIKNGCFTLDEFKEMVQMKQKEVNRLKEIYKSQEPDSDLHNWLDNQVKELIETVITAN